MMWQFWIGKSRLHAARLAECERCAQVIEKYLDEFKGQWTVADDYVAMPADERRAVMVVLQEAARRIRVRNDNRVEKP